MKSKKVSLIIIIVLAIIVGIGVYQAMNTQKTEIYLFKGDYKAGTQITEDMITTQEIDKSVVDNAIKNRDANGVVFVTKSNVGEAVGNFLKYDVFKGTPFMSNNVDTMGGSAAEVNLNKNMVAITIPVDNMSGVSNKLGKDSRVNIYAGFEGEEEKYTVQLLEDVRVLDVLVDYSQSDIPLITGVTVEVTPEDSLLLNHSLLFGQVRMGAVKIGQYEKKDQKAVTIEDIINRETK